ncbi:2',5'-phosphodiesterase 12 [Hydra vulgaris]|uniref:2',5'-phosphodiesterase 12 n=1 Tax=Hydra vulgaris TaxID=6087 RepID=A0ABM4B5I5_HYDVU
MDHYASVITNTDDIVIEFIYRGVKTKFVRPLMGELGKTLQRISLKLDPQKKTKNNKNKNAVLSYSTDKVKVLVFDKYANVVNDKITNKESFQEGFCMQIVSQRYIVQLNPPTIVKLQLPECIMTGFPVYPQLELFFANLKESKFLWFKSSSIDKEWEVIGESYCYTPVNNDIMFRLKCVCQPSDGNKYGPFSEEVISSPVLPGPGVCVFENRHLYTLKHIESYDKLRIITYNILADVFCDSEYAHEVLYPYCPKYALKLSYRMNLLIKELIGFNADILCLQECELKMFQVSLKPVLQIYNYEGYLNLKTGKMPEGEAIFIRKNKFIHLKDFSISVKEALYLECNKDILAAIQKNDIFDLLCKKSSIAQIHILAENKINGRHLCIFNTHLYFKPGAQLIRVLQIAVLLNYVEKILKEHQTKCFLIMCGDYNSKKGDPVLQFLNEKSYSLKLLYNLDCVLQCPFQLENVTGFPLFTVFVPQFRETLDYIFVDENFTLDGFVPIPLAEELEVFCALPSVVSPSDHIPLIVDLNWK